MSERLRYLGQSITVLSETTSVDSWCSTVTQSGLDYLLGPGGRAWAANEEWGRNGYAYGSPWRSDGRYYHYDRLGSVSSVSFDKPGLCFADYDYGPFGDTLGGSRGYAWSGMRGTESIGFTGQRLDAESGLYHFAYREYDGLVAQWTTSDPIKDGEAWYAYCGNNPVGFVDPTGLEHECGAGGSTPKEADYYYFGLNADVKLHYNDLFEIGTALSDSEFSQLQSSELSPLALSEGAGRAGVSQEIFFDWLDDYTQTGNPRYTASCIDAYYGGQAQASYAGAVASGLAYKDYFDDYIKRLPKKTIDPAEFAAGKGVIGPAKVRFSQDSAKSLFKDGRSVDDLIAGLRDGTIDPSDIPPIRLVEKDGQLFSLDNRRLFAFQEAGIPVPYRMATAEEIAAENFKFTTTNGGVSIRIRGGEK